MTSSKPPIRIGDGERRFEVGSERVRLANANGFGARSLIDDPEADVFVPKAAKLPFRPSVTING